MTSAEPATVRTITRTRAWVRSVAITGLLVLLIQISLAGSSWLFPAPAGPHSIVVVEVTAIAVAELITLMAVCWLLRGDRRSAKDLGLWQRATPTSWLLGVVLGLLTAAWGLSNPALHLQTKLGALFDASPWHMYSALVAGMVAGFCEETIFRGYVMDELAAAGHNRWVQVIGSAALFGVAHAGLLRIGLVAGLLIIIPTAILGVLYSLIYLNGGRSLMPVILSHFINDAAVIPWVFLAVASRVHH